MTRILACVDVSSYATSVADHAAWAANRTGASVDLLHVIGRKERGDMMDLSGALGFDANAHLLAELAAADEANARLAQERGRALLATGRARLLEAGVAAVETRHRTGSFVDTVAQMEADYDLLVIGKRGANADLASLHLGSNLERVVRTASKPVLVASRAFKPISRVLLAYDGGPSARKAVDHVTSHPLFGGLAVHVVLVGEPTAEATARLEEAADPIRRRGGAVVARVIPGDPEGVIGAYVKNERIDLLAIGAYGHSRVRQFLVGSTTSAMVRTCLIPVMLFR
ncbi:universal stress protein [Chthonobacter rhizosphaerae]|uniref:universal stress protein n=1 Tax=Chthonobacter rhizosphaerae TaxID=2735553 RepID=UPI0015EF5289|nr:universal stress protein [Chthonobacter rhizosphaerae]